MGVAKVLTTFSTDAHTVPAARARGKLGCHFLVRPKKWRKKGAKGLNALWKPAVRHAKTLFSLIVAQKIAVSAFACAHFACGEIWKFCLPAEGGHRAKHEYKTSGYGVTCYRNSHTFLGKRSFCRGRHLDDPFQGEINIVERMGKGSPPLAAAILWNSEILSLTGLEEVVPATLLFPL